MAKIWQKIRKHLVILPSTHFLADFGYPIIGFCNNSFDKQYNFGYLSAKTIRIYMIVRGFQKFHLLEKHSQHDFFVKPKIVLFKDSLSYIEIGNTKTNKYHVLTYECLRSVLWRKGVEFLPHKFVGFVDYNSTF